MLRRILHRIPRAAGVAGLLACLGLGALLAIPAALGFKRYVIVGRSMTGTYDRGSLVLDRPVPVAALRVGDVITYTPPGPPGRLGPVTHRIVWIGRDEKGRRAYRTKGDANPVADPWRFTLQRSTQARVAFAVPYVGYAIAALSLKQVRIALIGLPALLVALAVLAGLWHEAGEEARAAREGSAEPA
jgi:signal peptidase I